jgi:hypothetical protein
MAGAVDEEDEEEEEEEEEEEDAAGGAGGRSAMATSRSAPSSSLLMAPCIVESASWRRGGVIEGEEGGRGYPENFLCRQLAAAVGKLELLLQERRRLQLLHSRCGGLKRKANIGRSSVQENGGTEDIRSSLRSDQRARFCTRGGPFHHPRQRR